MCKRRVSVFSAVFVFVSAIFWSGSAATQSLTEELVMLLSGSYVYGGISYHAGVPIGTRIQYVQDGSVVVLATDLNGVSTKIEGEVFDKKMRFVTSVGDRSISAPSAESEVPVVIEGEDVFCGTTLRNGSLALFLRTAKGDDYLDGVMAVNHCLPLPGFELQQ